MLDLDVLHGTPHGTNHRFLFRGLHRGLRHGVHHRVFHDVRYSMVYTVEHDGICDDAMAFPMVCRMLMGCPMGGLTEYLMNGAWHVPH